MLSTQLFHRNFKLVNIIRKFSIYSCRNQVQAKSTTTEQPKADAHVEVRGESAAVKTSGKKPQRMPFVKSLFLGRFDTAALVFPEVLDKEKHETLHEMIIPIEKFFEEKVDGKKIDKEASIPVEVLQGLKQLGLYGQQIPTEYGGLGLNATEYARLNEIIALDGSIAVTLAAHQVIGLKGILIAGNNAQKVKYLPRLASGELTAAFCLTEPSCGSDAASVKTVAHLSDDGKTWILNGSKIWISNGGTADIMTVFAQAQIKDEFGTSQNKMTAFIVERNFGGVKSGKPEDKLGIRGSNTCEIFYENTPVPVENVLGEIGKGFKLAVNILNSGRFSMGSSGAGVLRKIMGWTVEHSINRKQFGRPISDFALIKEKLAGMALTIYAMESMAYLTAGMIDDLEDQDCSLESAIVKVFSSEGTWKYTSECLQIMGGLGYMKDVPFERYLRDSRIMSIFEGTNEILRLLIALSGVQFAGKELKDLVMQLRNPLLNPKLAFQFAWQEFRNSRANPKLNLKLHEHLHPSLIIHAKTLEFCVKRFEYAVQTVLRRNGAAISEPENQMDAARLANIAIDLYAMTAVLARASRSYCIGVRNSDHEMLLAMNFCALANERIETIVTECEDGPVVSADISYKRIADAIIQNGGYVPEHPLVRVFW